jgi:hypothetical protein
MGSERGAEDGSGATPPGAPSPVSDGRRPASRRWVAGGVLLAGGLVAGWAAPVVSTVPLFSVLHYHGGFQGGPPSTARNHGYLPWALVGTAPSIPVESYTAVVAPHAVGVQFVAAAPGALRRSGLRLTMGLPDGRRRVWRPRVTAAGLALGVFPRGLSPGTWQFVLGDPVLGYTPPWTVTVPSGAQGDLSDPAGAAAVAALSLLNGVRHTLGLDAATWGGPLARASLWHARYLARYGPDHPSFHVEEPGPGYYGRMPWDRDLRAGWPDGSTGEVGITAPTPLAGPVAVGALLDTVYHRLELLSANLTTLGFAEASGTAGAAAIMDLAFGYRPDLPLAVAYPPPGARGVPVAWLDTETPDPVPHGAGGVFGYPVTLDFPTVNRLGPTTLVLLQGTRVVPAFVVGPGRGDLAPNQVALVPRRALRPHTRYTVVSLAPRARFNDGSSLAVVERWQFWTGGGDQSVYAAYHGRALLITVDDAASDMVAAGVPLLVHIIGPRTVRASTITAPDGVAVFPVKLPPGRYAALITTASGGEARLRFVVAPGP